MKTSRKRMNRLRLLTGLLFIVGSAWAQPRLSPAAQVSLLTAGPGDELYSVFGHTALRVTDPMQGIDRIYGYGGFNFNTDNFYVKFLRGTLPYWLTIDNPYDFLYAYQAENRTLREQLLNLSPAQKQRIFGLLEENYKPENREYSYKFYYDNCATRPYDMIVKAGGDSLQLDPAQSAKLSRKSYRQWMNDYLGEKPWARFGMNLAVGRPADHVATAREAMYLPDNVFAQIESAKIRQASGQLLPLVARAQTLYQQNKPFKETPPLYALPEFLFLLLLILVAALTYRQYTLGLHGFWLDRLLFGVAGLSGWILFLLWVATDHGVTAWNPALLWLFPLHVPLIYWVTRPKNQRYLGVYFRTTAVLLTIGFFLSQVPGPADTLLIAMLYIRAFYQASFKPKTQAVSTTTA